MGGAFIGLADDATAAEANPAGLTILTKPEVSFEYRNTQWDNNFLNSFNQIIRGVADISSSNNLEDINQLSWLSVVFPSEHVTAGFSRQEVLNVKGSLDETLGLNLGTLDQPIFVDFASRATTEQKIVNWNFSLASKLSKTFSLGVTLRYSQLDFKSDIQNFTIVGPTEVPAFRTTVNDTDNKFAYNIGALWNANKHFSIGAVYKKNPKFEVQGVETETGPPHSAQKPGPFPNVFKVPDNYGFGVSIKPNDNMTISADYQRIEYSDLLEGFQAGYNIFTDLLDNNDIKYKISDANEFHVGAEFIVFLKTVPVALRQGYYRRPSNSLVVDTLAPQFAGSRNFLDTIFAKRDDENHFTFGGGAVFGPHFQLDFALDLANTSDSFVLSSVVRF